MKEIYLDLLDTVLACGYTCPFLKGGHMNWKFLAVVAPIIIISTGGGYYEGGMTEAVRYFLISVCGTGFGYCAGRLMNGR